MCFSHLVFIFASLFYEICAHSPYRSFTCTVYQVSQYNRQIPVVLIFHDDDLNHRAEDNYGPLREAAIIANAFQSRGFDVHHSTNTSRFMGVPFPSQFYSHTVVLR